MCVGKILNLTQKNSVGRCGLISACLLFDRVCWEVFRFLRKVESVMLAERQLATHKERFSIKLLDEYAPTLIKFNESTWDLIYSTQNAGTGASARDREIRNYFLQRRCHSADISAASPSRI